MTTVLLNEQIKPALLAQISQATTQISVVVAWFNDSDIFDLLLTKAQQSEIEIRIILCEESEDNSINTQLDFQKLLFSNNNVYVFKIPTEQILIHHKFCVLDKKTVITGSYNWTFGANFHNRENVVLIENEEALCQPFLDEFENLFDQYCKPIILSSIAKLNDLFLVIHRNIEHGNLRLANNVDEVIENIKMKYLSPHKSEGIEELSFEDFNEEISLESSDENIIKWWDLLPDGWKSYFLNNFLRVGTISSSDILSLRNLLSAIEKLDIPKNKMKVPDLFGLKNIICIKSLRFDYTSTISLLGIETLKELSSLKITSNQLKSFSEVNGLPVLEFLDLSNNQIESLDSLNENDSIKIFIFFGNPCTSLNGIENLKTLESFTCDNRFAAFPKDMQRLTDMGLRNMGTSTININGTRHSILTFTK